LDGYVNGVLKNGVFKSAHMETLIRPMRNGVFRRSL
jgi:hypothetical protein